MTHNQRIAESFVHADREGRLHHAYILSGPALGAKIACVEGFAASLDQNGAKARERICAGHHPDFVRLAELEENLPSVLEQVRELPKLLSYPPLSARRRVVLVPDAAALTAQAANSLLKVLEEPPHHTMFFLLCRDPGDLLQTIVSRCQVLRFAPLADEELLRSLPEGAVKAEDQASLLGWSEGALERAELLLRDAEAMPLRREACERLLELWEASPRIPSRCAAWVDALEEEANARIVVDTWELLLRDLAFAHAGAVPEQIRFRECFDRLKRLASQGGEVARAEIPSRASAINRFRVYRKANGNLRLDFAALLAELQIFSVGAAISRA